MTSVNTLDAKKSKKSAFSFLLWWRTDPAEVEKQVAGYNTLKVWQSARGISALLCAFSAVVTMLLGNLIHLSTGEVYFEVAIWSTVGILMYFGLRWAFILGMVLWTLEKATMLFSGGAAPIVQIIWWAIYLNAFFLAFRVESQRAAMPAPRARQA
jgi:hypothetical protein